MLKNKLKEQNNTNGLLSAVKPQAKLKLDNKVINDIKEYTVTKSILKVYEEAETHKLYIDFAAAYALHLTQVRAIMLDTPKYFEITRDVLDKIKSDMHYEIEYVKLSPRIKQDIMVYYKDEYLYIDPGAAYALGFITVSEFNNNDNMYGPLNDTQIAYIKYNFNVNYASLNVEDSRKR